MNVSIAARLSAMMFIQFFVWGAWYVTAYLYLEKIGFGGSEIKWTYSVGPIAGLISPFFVGMIADRFFSTERVLGVLHLLGGVAMFLAIGMMGGGDPEPIRLALPGMEGFTISLPAFSLIEDPSAVWINIFFFAHMLCYFPTLALTNSLALHNVTDAERQFPLIRVFGTIGWIVAGLLISWQGWDAAINLFYLAAVAAILMGLYSFTLPHTPPPSAGQKPTVREVLGLDALVLLKRPSFLIFMISSFLVCIPLAFYYQMAGKFVDHAGLANPAFKMSFGQMSEIFFMVVMPLFFVRLGVKWMLFVGMLAWVLRYALFAMAADEGIFWMVMTGVILHGICYDFFFVTGQIYTDRVAPRAIRSQAQGMLVLFTLGLGMLIGAQIAGQVETYYTQGYSEDDGNLFGAMIHSLVGADDADEADGDATDGDAAEETEPGMLRRWLAVESYIDPAQAEANAEQARQIGEQINGLQTQLAEAPPEDRERLELTITNLREQRSDRLLDSQAWLPIWALPAVFAAVIMVLFALFFRDDGHRSVGEPDVAKGASVEKQP
ncbi:MAG: nucleoside permease [Pirellulales bacterium]